MPTEFSEIDRKHEELLEGKKKSSVYKTKTNRACLPLTYPETGEEAMEKARLGDYRMGGGRIEMTGI